MSDGRVVQTERDSGDLLVYAADGTFERRLSPPAEVDLAGWRSLGEIHPAGSGEYLLDFRHNRDGEKSRYGYLRFGASEPTSFLETGYVLLAPLAANTGWWSAGVEGARRLDGQLVPRGPILHAPARYPGQYAPVQDIASSAGGALAVLQRVHWPSSVMPRLDYACVYALDTGGELLSEVHLSPALEQAARLLFDGRNVLLYTGKGRLWSLDLPSGRYSPIEVPQATPPINLWSLTFVDKDRELRACGNVPGDTTILRLEPIYRAGPACEAEPLSRELESDEDRILEEWPGYALEIIERARHPRAGP